MGYRKRALVLLITSVMLLTVACGQQKEAAHEEDSSKHGATVTWIKTKDQIQPSIAEVVYSPGETVPIMLEGKVMGYLKVNWVQRLGIWDLGNKEAVMNGVHESYTINMNVNFINFTGKGRMITASIKPVLVDVDGREIGSPCIVGWSGFATEAQLYDEDRDVDVEFGVQPEVSDVSGAVIRLDIKDNAGNVYDHVFLSNEYLVNAQQGQSLVTEGQKTIHSINGAAFSLEVSDVYYEEHSLKGQYVEDSEELKKASFCDFTYRVSYDTLPSNGREVRLFDSNNNSNLNSRMVCYTTLDVDQDKSYENDVDALRLKYSDTDDVERYVTEQFIQIPVGHFTHATLNRRLSSKKADPQYLRVHFEFQEEADARTLEEMRDFDGRFLVFQQRIGERGLGSYYDSEEYKATLESEED